jgi:hypothetical protein
MLDPKPLLERMATEVNPSPGPPARMLRRSRWRRVRTVALSAIVAAAVIGGGYAGVRSFNEPTTVPAATTPCSWTVLSTPDHEASSNELRSISVVSSDDAWAVGSYYVNEEGGYGGAAILHWDGSTWSLVPHPQGPSDTLYDIIAIAADDVWAVGASSDENGNRPTGLIEHWDGEAWAVVPAADPGTTYWQLEGIAASGSNDVWAVGNATDPDYVGGTLIEHWDGTAWSIVESPSPKPQPLTGSATGALNDVTVISPTDAWAVGEVGNVAPVGASNTLIEHWDGTSWTVVQSPDVVGKDLEPHDILFSVAGGGPNDVWAVGTYNDTLSGYGGKGDHVLIEHWDGQAWQSIDAPTVGAWSRLFGVTAFGNEMWAVGSFENETGDSFGALVLHWDGSTWDIVTDPATPDAGLSSVTIDQSLQVWAAGSTIDGSVASTLVIRCT